MSDIFDQIAMSVVGTGDDEFDRIAQAVAPPIKTALGQRVPRVSAGTAFQQSIKRPPEPDPWIDTGGGDPLRANAVMAELRNPGRGQVERALGAIAQPAAGAIEQAPTILTYPAKGAALLAKLIASGANPMRPETLVPAFAKAGQEVEASALGRGAARIEQGAMDFVGKRFPAPENQGQAVARMAGGFIDPALVGVGVARRIGKAAAASRAAKSLTETMGKVEQSLHDLKAHERMQAAQQASAQRVDLAKQVDTRQGYLARARETPREGTVPRAEQPLIDRFRTQVEDAAGREASRPRLGKPAYIEQPPIPEVPVSRRLGPGPEPVPEVGTDVLNSRTPEPEVVRPEPTPSPVVREPLDSKVAEKYKGKKWTDDALFDQLEVYERRAMDAGGSDDLGRGIRHWTREDYNAVNGQGTPLKRSGTTINNAAGRKLLVIKRDGRLADEVRSVLRSRGLTDEAVDQAISRRLMGPELGDAADEALAGGSGSARFNPADFDEVGAVKPLVVARLAGAGVGATVGAATGDRNDRAGTVGRAAIGAVAGAVAPDVLRAFRSSGGKLSTVNRSYQRLLDGVYSLRKFGRTVGKSEELSDAASTAKGWQGFADELAGLRGKPSGAFANDPTLHAALVASHGVEDEVVAVSQAQRALELEKNGMGWKLGTVTPADARATIAQHAGNAKVQTGVQALRNYYDHLLELKHRAGLIDGEALKELRAKGEFYTPFVRDFDSEGRAVIGAGKGGQVQGVKTVRAMQAGDASAAIVNPFQQAIYDTQIAAKAILRQRVNQVLGGIVQADPHGSAPFIKDLGTSRAAISPQASAEGRIVEAILNGKRHHFEVTDPDLLEAIAFTPARFDGPLMKVLKTAKNVFRTGVTLLPSFTISNATRDAFFTSTSYRFPVKASAIGGVTGAVLGAATADDDEVMRGAIRGAAFGVGGGAMAVHGKRILGAMRDIFGHSEAYQQFLREGGAGSGMFVKDEADAAKLLKALRHRGVGSHDILIPRNPLEALRILNQAVEEAPRLAKFKQILTEGGSKLAAGGGARDVSVDFFRGGSDPLVQFGKNTAAFWSPKMQGLDKVRRTLFSEGGRSFRAWGVGVATMTLPSLALYDINKDDPSYRKRPLWERNAFWLIPVGTLEDGETRFLRVPKPFEPGAVFASLPERLAEYLYTKDPEKFAAAMKSLLRNTTEGALPIPTLAKAPLEASMGKAGFDTFRGKPIVSQSELNLPTGEQYTSQTPFAAVALGKAIGVSPEKVRHVIRGAFGPSGDVVNEFLVDPAAKAAGVDPRPVAPAERLLEQSRFITKPGGFSTDDVDAMFRRFERGAPHAAQVRSMIDDGDPTGAGEYARAHKAELLEYLKVKGTVEGYEGGVRDFRKVAKLRRTIEGSQTLTAERKRTLLQRLGKMAGDIAEKAVTPQPSR